MSRSRIPAAYAKKLSATPLFCGMEESAIVSAVTRAEVTVVHVEKGGVIYAPEDFLHALGVILYGRAQVTKGGADSRMLMSVLEAGELFGAATLFNDSAQYVAEVRAIVSTWALMMSEDALKHMMRLDFRIAENYMRYLTARVRYLSGRIDGFVRPTLEDRVLLYMVRGAKDGLYTPPMGVSGLAEALCIGRTSLYRAIDALTNKGRIIKQGRSFRLSEGTES